MADELTNKTPEELWQEAEDERLEYEGYCRKIKQGLESQDAHSGIRAIWELVQNARDQSKHAKIEITLSGNSLIFSHHGNPFDYTSFRALVKQDSSKDRTDANLVGQYGTGFMTTHTFNRLVYVSAPFAVKRGKEDISGYVQIKDFRLDRTKVDTPEGPAIMKEQLNEVRNFRTYSLSEEILDDTTSFRYDLTESQVREVSSYIAKAVRLMPFVMILNRSISEIEVDDKFSHTYVAFRRGEEVRENAIGIEGWNEMTENVVVINRVDNTTAEYNCKSLRSDKGDVVIIPPYPTICGEVGDIPSLFLWFPLLGTEKFGVNFIFHSERFYPVEKRNNIMLPGASQISQEKGGENEKILKEMMAVLFEYYTKPENAATLDIDMCRVDFPVYAENDETLKFYQRMQSLWNQEIVKWKVIPVGEERASIKDEKVRLLHSSFYKELQKEDWNVFEQVTGEYAKAVQFEDGSKVMMPDDILFAWSELVKQWRCEDESDFYLEIEDVCLAIKGKSDQLINFLKLLKAGGNEKAMADYPLLPNRDGKLCLKDNLRYGSFMTDEIYSLVKVVMGDDAAMMIDPAFLEVCSVIEYKKSTLQDAITLTIRKWRNKILGNENATLTEEELNALIRFCFASHLAEFKNQRGRLMPLLNEFYETNQQIILTIKFREEEEEEFYKQAFGFLLDYTLSLLCQNNAEWVKSHIEWLLNFLTIYAPNENEERKGKVNKYGVLPNQEFTLCKLSDLKVRKDVPDDLLEIYKEVFNKNLKVGFIHQDFVSLVDLDTVEPKDIADVIQRVIVTDMQKEKDRKYEKVVRKIILKISDSKDWEDWFSQINDKKAAYTFSMKTGEAQKHLFSIMDNMNDNHLKRLAQLGEEGNIDYLLEKMERLQELEYESAARFNHLYTIGRHIEEELLKSIDKGIVETVMPESKDDSIIADDIQDGQDIIVRVKINDTWKDIFYIEVKSKWDFSVEPAHMSTRQVRMASLHQDEYALCCVDLRPYKDQDLANLPRETILASTKVKMDIGHTLYPLMESILAADGQSDETQIKISEYRSNMSAKVFEQGEPFDVLIKKIVSVARNVLDGEDKACV